MPFRSRNKMKGNVSKQVDLDTSLAGNTYLVALINTANLKQELLEQSNNITVLAPSNKAIESLPKIVLEFLQDPNNIATLREILLFHIISNNSNALYNSNNTDILPKSITIEQVLIPPSLETQITELIKNNDESIEAQQQAIQQQQAMA